MLVRAVVDHCVAADGRFDAALVALARPPPARARLRRLQRACMRKSSVKEWGV